jgi:hypothetical protein
MRVARSPCKMRGLMQKKKKTKKKHNKKTKYNINPKKSCNILKNQKKIIPKKSLTNEIIY